MRRTVDVEDVALPGNRTLRVALSRAEDGTPEDLTFALGWNMGRGFTEDRTEGLTVPAVALAGLVAALQRLQGT